MPLRLLRDHLDTGQATRAWPVSIFWRPSHFYWHSYMANWLFQYLFAPSVLPSDDTRWLLLRAMLAGCGLLVVALCGGLAAIRWLRNRFIEPIKSASLKLDELHRGKQSTPTMGGLFLISGLCLAVVLLGDATNHYVLLTLAVTLGLAVVGAVDDLVKLRTTAAGLGWRAKLLSQSVIALPAAACLCWMRGDASPWLTIPWVMLVVVGSSNAVNITDGLDGLAAGCLTLAMFATGCAIYALGNPATMELIVVAAAAIGGLLGFLWFNRYPARVFMGNTGSLPLGGLLGMLAASTGQELLLVVSGGVFVAEAVSVLVQIGSFRCFRRRVFRCAPLHHHFEFLGWPERRVVTRFWGAAAICAASAVAIVSYTSQAGQSQSSKSAVTNVASGRIQVHAAKPVLRR